MPTFCTEPGIRPDLPIYGIGFRIHFQNGRYTTEDPREVQVLRGRHDVFERRLNDGLSARDAACAAVAATHDGDVRTSMSSDASGQAPSPAPAGEDAGAAGPAADASAGDEQDAERGTGDDGDPAAEGEGDERDDA